MPAKRKDPIGELAQAAFEYEFKRFLRRVHGRGFVVVIDTDAVAVRIVTTAQAKSGADLRRYGRAILMDGVCGGRLL